MKKQQKEAVIKPKKQGKQLKDFLPSTIKNNPHEQIPLKIPDQINREYVPLIQPNHLAQEWPGDEEAMVKI
jgi:hypothetical protein